MMMEIEATKWKASDTHKYFEITSSHLMLQTSSAIASAGLASIPDVLDIQSGIKQDCVPAIALIQAEHD